MDKSLSLLIVLSLAHLVVSKVYFQEDFSSPDYTKKWIQSTHSGKEFGEFKWTAGKFYDDPEKDKGLQTTQDARFYAISTKFPEFSNEGKDLVVQFSVKHEQSIDCGGGYVKVFDCSLDPASLHGESTYRIMFGPDICGPGTKKVR
jgi:calreticulin